METTHRDSAGYLKEIFSEASRANPRFSLRAFAKKLGLSPGGLSQILARKKRLSIQRAHVIAQALGLDPKEKEYLLLIVQIEGTKNAALKAELCEKLRLLYPERAKSTNLTVDQFRMISEWYGLALLEHVTIIGGNWPTQKTAKYFGITKAEVETMLERLERLELIEKTEQGYRRVADRLMVESQTPSEAIRNYYQSVLTKSKNSITEQSPREKVVGTEVFAFDPSDLKEVKALTDDYFENLLALAKKGKKRTEIYQVFADVFRLNELTETTKTPRREIK